MFSFNGHEAEQLARLEEEADRVCVSCGCTAAHACPAGCSWVSPDFNLCTACVGPFPCAGYRTCTNTVPHRDEPCPDCCARNERENAGGCPGCGGYCQTACR
jgi:hypothetical protein